MSDGAMGYGSPWAADGLMRTYYRDRRGNFTALVSANAYGGAAGYAAIRDRIVRCVSACQGVPDAALDAPTDLERLCLAVLRSGRTDSTPVAMLADEALAAATAGADYVSRGELLRMLWRVYGSMWNGRSHQIAVELRVLLDAADPGGEFVLHPPQCQCRTCVPEPEPAAEV